MYAIAIIVNEEDSFENMVKRALVHESILVLTTNHPLITL